MEQRDRRQERRRADHDLPAARRTRALRVRGQGVRADRRDGPQARAAHGSLLPVRARGCARGDRGLGPRCHRRRARRAHGHGCRDRHRRTADARSRARAPVREGHRSHEPALDHDADPEHGCRHGLDGVRLPRALEHGHDRVRRVLDGDRRCRRNDPRRTRRRDGRRRQRGADHADRRRRLLCDARDLAAQRRSADGQPAVRRGARRLRDRRGLHDRRARGARARPGARRQDLRRDHGLRLHGRRPSLHRAGSVRRRAGAGDAHGARGGRHGPRARSTTSTPTAPRPRSATAPRRAPSRWCWARSAPTRCRSPPRSR